MDTTAATVRNMLDTLEEEDYKMAVNYIQFLYDSRKKAKVKKATEAMDRIQTIVGNDKGWDSEEEMLEDMARFRRERMGI